MGFTKKSQIEASMEPDGKRWVIAGVSLRASLKPINTKPRPRDGEEEGEEEEEPCSTTPTNKESRIPEKIPCPPAPMKRRPPSKCRLNGVREFFTPPDLETVFKLRAGRTN